MKKIRQLKRLLYINYVLAKNGLDQVILGLHLFAPFRFMVYLNPWNWFRGEPLPRGVAIRKTLEELGPIFIKFGQALSTRPDILPPDIALELSKLQDKVPPFGSELALSVIEKTYGIPAHEVFAEFDAVVLASASISQVHAARLKTGEDVVVKILRPDIRKNILKDLSIMHSLAKLADRYWSESKRLKPKEVVKEFEQILMDELNLQREAANASQLRRNFSNSSALHVPEVYWDYVRENILVMERIYGIPVTDIEALNAHGINIKKLAESGIEIFFTQVFRDRFFHADMHPGNIFVSPTHKENPQYISVDFGIIGSLNDDDTRYIAENLLAFFNRDYRRVAQLHVDSGWVGAATRVDDFESAIRTVCEPIFERPLKDISFAMILLQLFQAARRFKMEIQPQFVLLQKTLLAVEGLGRQLYPSLDLWTTAKPFLEKWVREQVGPGALLKSLKTNLPFFVEQLPNLPRLFNDVLLYTKAQKVAELKKMSSKKEAVSSRTAWFTGLGAGIFVGLFSFSMLNYGAFFEEKTITVLALSTAVIAGFFSFLNRKPRR